MPAPTTIEEFVDLIRRSSVLDEARLDGYVKKLKTDPNAPKDLSAIAGHFVSDGLLTFFQAEQFLQGRWKRFNIGKYKVLEKLGAGGMGTVFLCEHKLMRRRVAVKVLPTVKASDPSSLERFYREARAVAALDHTNIVRAYDIDQDDNLHFLVMEYVDGASMQDMIRKSGPMEVIRACHYIYWSAIGLQHAHENGLLHRDIKPGNILVDRQGIVKILDLGLARFFNDDQDLLTKKFDENVLGTADYLAPEQAIDSHSVTGRADIYSLGATFYYLLTGNPPFTEGTVAQKLLWHQTRQPKSIREFRNDIPEGVIQILEKMMAKKQEDRYQTPNELAEALLPWTQTPIAPPTETEMPVLSLAAQGGGSPSVSANAPPRTSGMTPRSPLTPKPRAYSNGQENQTRRAAPVPVVEPIHETVDHIPNWEAFENDTTNSKRDDTARRKSDSGSKSKPKVKPKSARKLDSPKEEAVATTNPNKKKLLFAGLSALLLVVLGVGIYFIANGSKNDPRGGGSVVGSKRVILTKNPSGENQFASLRDAAKSVKAGDEIIIQDDVWEESVGLTSLKNVSISAADGKRVTWKAPPKGATYLLSLFNAENVRISNIDFEGGNQVESAIRLSGKCPGLTLQDLSISDATKAVVAMHECSGESSRPVTLTRCRIRGGESDRSRNGILFSAASVSNVPKNPYQISSNQDIVVSSCRIEGGFSQASILFEESAIGVQIRQCRIWKAPVGILFGRPSAGTIWKVDLVSNTLSSISIAGIQCEDVGPMKKNENRLLIEQNLFVKCGKVSHREGDFNEAKFVAAKGNFRGRGMPEGEQILFPTQEIDLPANFSENTSEKSFLLYRKDDALQSAFEGRPVGATE
jgi:serine/threonine protein kinase